MRFRLPFLPCLSGAGILSSFRSIGSGHSTSVSPSDCAALVSISPVAGRTLPNLTGSPLPRRYNNVSHMDEVEAETRRL
ncbi:hypothetical protein RJ640_015859 [Escallonia rubra]|uniref:Uncharacterized protein n=1 Tax=Escallonia rubra TaxID=112253 RepID=A0AA88R9X9_9ASTE|nr:hypothetical protein RJ640_015859 [Escallonia rubra]